MAAIVGLGEVMIRLAPPNRLRIEQAHSFDIEIGGAEFNTLVGLSRLGHECMLVTRLPDSPLGRMVRNRIREFGINTEYVKLVDEGRQGLCFFESGAEPRPAEVHYDRGDSAMSRIQPDEFDWKDIAEKSNWFHVSGITPALSESAAATVEIALRTAGEVECGRSLDLNYRTKLWSVERAQTVFDRIIPHSTILLASAGDASLMFGIDSPQFALQLLQRFGSRGRNGGGIGWVASTTRKESSGLRGMISGQLVGRNSNYESAEYHFDIVDRIGAGDAFASGLIDGFLTGSDDLGIETAAIMAALQHTIPGDMPIMTKADIDSVRVNKTTGVRR